VLPYSRKFARTRLAPTPSGFLHLGNLFSFSITAALAEETGADVFLRIDDLDQARASPRFIADIFQSLEYLDFRWSGPADKMSFEGSYSQALRMPLYEQALQRLADLGLVYACACTRQSGRTCAGNCQDKGLPLEPGLPWRIKTGVSAPVSMRTLTGARQMVLPETMRDFVVRRRDGLPAYQLCSVLDDVFYGIDLIVRGADLLDSTVAQLHLARALKLDGFSGCTFVHHRLLYGDHRQKLSKSAGDTAIITMRENGASAPGIFLAMCDLAGIPPARHWREFASLDLGMIEN
jgi:glutamyl/glutaminyl-tRNA synthetase